MISIYMFAYSIKRQQTKKVDTSGFLLQDINNILQQVCLENDIVFSLFTINFLLQYILKLCYEITCIAFKVHQALKLILELQVRNYKTNNCVIKLFIYILTLLLFECVQYNFSIDNDGWIQFVNRNSFLYLKAILPQQSTYPYLHFNKIRL